MLNRMILIENISEIKKQEADLHAVIFGLDDILYPLTDYVQSGFRQISRLFLGRSQEVYEELWNTYEERCTMGTDDAVTAAIQAMLRKNELDSEEMEAKCQRIYEQHTPKLQPYDGVVELLDDLHDKGLRLGLLTDGPAEAQREKIRSLGIASLFDEIIITDDFAGNGDVAKFRTPNPICFEIMQLRLDVPFEKTGYVSANLRSCGA